ncbi:Hypothetical protein NCS54_00799600 [Fusarium falciforme]|uniref:Hypothetical protein n=1 Tax=Fusarium falciforme TaxID=195108 RepID=UPI00230049CC|nr:Hypothetical protein NCS54_00799600 [Fusarium falciforme]WAO90562.1 Hypothetical protein NCS54_00799600 [Fusarium falciforme]
MAAALSLRLTATAFLALSASASSLVGDIVLRTADDVLNRPYISLLTSTLSGRDENSTLDQLPAPNVALAKDGSLNLTAWNADTNKACREVLGGLHQSTNPSGACVCYNLPSLDMKTGVFEADLRLFKVSEARGGFASVAPEDVQVGVTFDGATVMPIDPRDMNGTGMVGQVASMTKREAGPELMQTYMFVGRIDPDKMRDNMTMADLEYIIMPTLTLTAKNSTGGTIRTNVSINEAAFLTGVFSQDVVMSDFARAQAAVDEQIAGLKNGTVAFVLPGVQLMVFPIGLIITSIWLVIFVAAVGFGTYERFNYAEMYKRRQAVSVPRGPTI